MKAAAITASLVLGTFLNGCVNLKDLTDVANIVDSLPTDGSLSCKDPIPRVASKEASDLVPASVDKVAVGVTLPPRIGEHSVTQKLLESFETQVAKHNFDAPRSVGAEPITGTSFETKRHDLSINSSELQDFFKAFSETMLQPSNYTGAGRSSEAYDKKPSPRKSADTADSELDPQRSNVAHVFKVYYMAYINGGYTDRNGTKFAKPEIKKGISNDVISAALMIFLDALADTQLRTPVFKSGNIYYPSGESNQPTSSLKKIVKTVTISAEPEKCGITEPEAKAMSYISNMAGDKSTLLSGLVLQSFAHVHASFIVGGNFAVGDNETFATLVKTFFESAARRGVERGAYEFFWAYTYNQSELSTQTSGTETPRSSTTSAIEAPRKPRANSTSQVFTYYDVLADNQAEGRAAPRSAKINSYDSTAAFLEDFQ